MTLSVLLLFFLFFLAALVLSSLRLPVCRSSLPSPPPFHLRRCLRCSPFHREPFLARFFRPLLPSRPEYTPTPCSIFPATPHLNAPLLRYNLFFSSPLSLSLSPWSCSLILAFFLRWPFFSLSFFFFFFFFCFFFFFFFFFCLFFCFHSSTFFGYPRHWLVRRLLRRLHQFPISDGQLSETGAADYYDRLIGNESPPPPPPTPCHTTYAPTVDPAHATLSRFFRFICAAGIWTRGTGGSETWPNPPVTDVPRQLCYVPRARPTSSPDTSPTMNLTYFQHEASHLRWNPHDAG